MRTAEAEDLGRFRWEGAPAGSGAYMIEGALKPGETGVIMKSQRGLASRFAGEVRFLQGVIVQSGRRRRHRANLVERGRCDLVVIDLQAAGRQSLRGKGISGGSRSPQ